MTALYQRRARLVIGTRVIETDGDRGLRIAFTVTRTSNREANAGTIRVYNLAPATRAEIAEAQGRIALEAGYADASGAILVATKGEVQHAREGSEWVTEIEVEDGRAEFAQRATGSYAANVSAAFVLDDLVRQARVTSGVAVAKRVSAAAQAKLSAAAYAKGYALTPDLSIAKAIEDVAKKARVRASFQDGAVQVLDTNEASLDQVVVLRAGSGLIGSPRAVTETKKKGDTEIKRHLIRGESLLRAELVPNVRVQIESAAENALVRLTRVDHIGDTHGSGGAWVTRWEGVRS